MRRARPVFDATVAGRRHARPGIAWRASRVYAGGQLKYEGRRGAYDPPTACAASIDLDDALAMVQHGRALRLSGWEGFFVANAGEGSTQQAMPTFLQWCVRRRSRGLPTWGCGMRALRLYVRQTRRR